MPDDTLDETPISSRRSHTPEERDDAAATVRKRRRIALSCYDCRRRKLRCDREYPACGRCRKGGHAETCSYDSRAQPTGPRDAQALSAGSEDDHTLSPSNSNPVNRTLSDGHRAQNSAELLAFQRQKISELESRLAQLEGKANQPTAAFGDPVQHAGDELLWPSGTHGRRKPAGTTTTEESETMLLRGKAFKTAYFGRSNITSVIITHVSLLIRLARLSRCNIPRLLGLRQVCHAMYISCILTFSVPWPEAFYASYIQRSSKFDADSS